MLFLAANPLPVLALLVGGAGVHGRVDTRAAAALGVALALDTVVGVLVALGGTMWPQRLQEAPSGGIGWSPGVGGELALSALTLAVAVPLVMLGPAARSVRGLESRPTLALWLGLGANAVDAVATWLGLHTEAVAEANPLVRVLGLGGKWLLVTVLLLVLHRVRPGLVWLVTVAYLLVVAYHLVGGVLLA